MDTHLRRRSVARPGFDRLESRELLATLPAGFSEASVATGLTNPTAMEIAPGGLLFITEQAGTMEVFRGGQRLQSNFFQDTPLTVNSAGERGLLGVAVDPNFTSNGYVYIYYTATSPTIHNRLSRFTADTTRTKALAGSETILLDIGPLSSATNHNGGAVHFGPDGKLYLGVGDNADGGNSPSLSTLKGKILRLNPDGSIPTDNPFFNRATGDNRAIWAIGLRNPFTFAFQPGTGRMFINDVGQSTFEEINDGIAGADYGWPSTEGPTAAAGITGPFYSYGRTLGQAISGGAFYNPATNRFPADYAGDYFFADFGSSTIRRIDTTTKEVSSFATGARSPVDLRVGDDGALYYLSRGRGEVVKVDATAVVPPAPTTASVTVRTEPPGLQIVVDGRTIGGPSSFSGTIGSIHTLAAPASQDSGGATFVFAGWSDGGPATREYAVAATDSTVTAVYTLVAARVNFTPAGVTSPADYASDRGAAFASRSPGLTFGWNRPNMATATFRRGKPRLDRRLATFLAFRGPADRWELALASGTYAVRVVTGDPASTGRVRLNVEGQTIRGRTARVTRWLESTVTVTITDGRLTLSGARGTKLNYVDIVRVGT